MEIAAILLAVTLGLILWLYFRKWGQLPPGPWGLPLVGYYPFLTSSMHRHLYHLSKQYGEVMSFTIFGRLYVHLQSLDVLREVLSTRADEFTGKPQEMNLLTWLDGCGLGVVQEEGAAWKEHRRFFLQAAKNFGFGRIDLESQMHEEVRSLLQDLRKTNGEPTDLVLHTSHTSSSLICRILFKKPFRKDDPVFQEIVHGLNYYMSYFLDAKGLLVGPFFEHVVMKLFPIGRELKRTRKVLHEAINKIVDEHLETFNKSNIRDFVDAYIDERRKQEERGELDKSTFTIARLHALSINMFVEGTISSTFCNLLKALSYQSEEQKKAQVELDDVVGATRLPSWLDRSNLPYTDALIQELIRTSHPFNLTTIYCNYEITNLRGYRIPKRSILMGNLWAIHHDPETFPNPSKFDPTRFLGPDGKRIKTEGPFPFGVGKRTCIAEAFAQMEIFIVISSILQNFTLLPVEDDEPNVYRVRALPRSKLVDCLN